MDVQPYRVSGCLMVFLGLATLGVSPLAIWFPGGDGPDIWMKMA